MRWLVLYLRARRTPLALGVAAGTTAATWLMTTATAEDGPVDPIVRVLTVVLSVAALAVTLGGPDDALDRTAARPWRLLRASHLLAALGVVVALLIGVRYEPFGAIVRDGAGLLGLTALGAATLGPARSWFVPVAWTLAALAFPLTGRWGEALTWQSQTVENRAAAAVAGVLALGGGLAYVLRGPLPRTEP